MIYPDKFVVKSKNDSYGFTWDATKLEGTDTWSFQERNSTSPIGPYSAELMASFWSSCEFIFPEPALVFPFTFTTDLLGNILCKAEKSAQGDIEISWGGRTADWYTEEEIKSYVKSGHWIVKSVGEQTPVEAPTSVVGPLTVEVDTSQVKAATEALKELEQAARKTEDALLRLKNVFNY